MSISISLIIIAFTVFASWKAWQDRAFMNNMVFNAAAIKERGEWYRFFSSGFVHKDTMHLVFNMYALYIFGSAGEYAFGIMFGKTLGGTAFLLFYLAAIGVSEVVSYQRHQDNYAYTSLGASGGVSAALWPFVMLGPWNWFIFPPLPAIILGVGYILYSDYKDRTGNDMIGHSAHLWGAIFGLVAYAGLSALFAPELLEFFWVQLLQPQGPEFSL